MLTSGCPDELPNPHKNCVREILNALVCHDHDFRRLSVDLRDLQNEFKREMEKIEFRCTELRRPQCPYVDDDKKPPKFAHHIATIDEVNECFSARIAALRQQRDELAAAAKRCLLQLSAEKCNFKQFHERTVDHLKRTAINANDAAVVKNCEKDICELHRLFVREVASFKRCEQELQPFLAQLKDDEFQNFCRCCCFKEYDWLPLGKHFEVVDKIGDQIKESMGSTLREAFAQMHLHQPADMKSFLAAYLLNLDRNERMTQEKLNLFGTI